MASVDSPPAEETARGRPRPAPGGTAWGLIGALGGAAANFAVLLVIAAVYGATVFGVFSAVAALFQLGTASLRMGTDVGATYTVGRTADADRALVVPAVLRAALTPVVAVSTMVAVGVALAAPQIAGALSAGDTDLYVSMLRIVAVALPFATAGEVLLATTRGFGSMTPTVIASNGVRQVGQLLTVGIAALVSDRVDVLAVAWAVPYLATVAYPIWWLRSRCGKDSGPAPWRALWRYSGPQAATATVQGGLEKIDIVMLQSSQGATATAVYSMANRFVHLVVLARYTIGIASSADFAQALERNDAVAARELAARVGAWTALVCTPPLVVLLTMPDAVLGIVGGSYRPGSTALAVLALGLLVSIGFGPAPTMLVMDGATGRSFVYSAMALALNIGLNLVLIPRHGPSGAAIAWAVAVIVPRALALVTVHDRTGVWATTRPLLLAMTAGAAPFLVAGLGARAIAGDALISLVAGCAVGTAGWGLIVRRLGDQLHAASLLQSFRPSSPEPTR